MTSYHSDNLLPKAIANIRSGQPTQKVLYYACAGVVKSTIYACAGVLYIWALALMGCDVCVLLQTWDQWAFLVATFAADLPTHYVPVLAVCLRCIGLYSKLSITSYHVCVCFIRYAYVYIIGYLLCMNASVCSCVNSMVEYIHCIDDSPRRPEHLLSDDVVACVTLRSSDMLWCCVEWPLPCGQGTTSVLRECGHCLSMHTHTHTHTLAAIW